MKELPIFWMVSLGVLFLSGCGSKPIEKVDNPREPTTIEPIQPDRPPQGSLAQLLEKPRAELASQGDELLTRLLPRDKALREGRLPMMLPEIRFPLIVPVLQQARFSPRAGFSLPPYAPEGTQDSELAWHLARYGDHEAAGRLVNPGDREMAAQIAACRYERNYPVEWTRLVGLLFHEAQIRLASGEKDARRDLLDWHRQLTALLDARAAQSPLGGDLLCRGREVLNRAGAAWRSRKEEALAKEVEAPLLTWKPVSPVVMIPPLPRSQLARILGGKGDGYVLPAQSLLRAFDLLDLPFPAEGSQEVLAFVNDKDLLTDLLVIYRPGLVRILPEPRNLAHLLEDWGWKGKDSRSPGLMRRTYDNQDSFCEVIMTPRSEGCGALVHLSPRGSSGRTRTLARDVGELNLDRSFEQNRLRVAPDQLAEWVQTRASPVLSRISNPLGNAPLVEAAVQRAGDSFVTNSLILRFYLEQKSRPLSDIFLKLLASAGPPLISSTTHGGEDGLTLSWEDERTRYLVLLPFADGTRMELEVADRPGTQDLAARAAAALALDRKERVARLAEGKLLLRLPRQFPGQGVRLGQERSQVLAALPTGPYLTKQEWPQGVYLIDSSPAPKTPYLVRHSFIRFDSQGRVAELRNRYGPGETKADWQQGIGGGLVKQGGAAAEEPGPWQRSWEDLPPGKHKAKLYRWQDDLTVVTCQWDSWLTEVVLRDAGNAEGVPVPLPPLEYLPRGPGPVLLGAAREEVDKQYADGSSRQPDGSIIVRPPNNSPYETLILWFAADRVVRMVAHHNQAIPAGASPPQLARFLRQAWGGETARLGWPCRQDFGPDRELQTLGWQDDRTRIRMGWQYSQHGPPRLFTEWKVLPDKAP